MSGFSVVIPVYNRAGLVEACLARFTGPEARGIEVVVVDDGSTDGTAAAVERIAAASGGADIRLVRQDNAGPGPARNRGAREARHDWVVFHDSDDLWMPWTIAHLRRALEGEAADARVLFLAAERFSDPGEPSGWPEALPRLRRHDTLLDFKLTDGLPLAASSNVAFRRADFLALGGFDAMRHGEDTDLFFRAGLLGPVGVIAAPTLVAYRVHDDNARLTNASDRVRVGRFRFLLDRNREGRYPGPADKRARALSRAISYAVRGNFAKGNLGPAYGIYLQGAGTLRAAGLWGELLRLPLTPLLHYVRPRNYPFRWSRGGPGQ